MMKFNFHNKIEIKAENNSFVYFNQVLPSVFEPLSQFESYSAYLAVGFGTNDNVEQTYTLADFFASYPLEVDTINSDISKGTLFVKKNVRIDDENLSGKYITEVGITNGNSQNIVYNYFNLIDEQSPSGIFKKTGEDLLISITTYLEISQKDYFILTTGDNKFIEFLLGEGIDGEITSISGKNLISNDSSSYAYYVDESVTKMPCQISFDISESSLNFSIETTFSSGDLYEVCFLIGNSMFARLNICEFKPEYATTITLQPKTHYVIDVGKDIKSVESVENLTTETLESDYYIKSYANSFGAVIENPFNNLYDNNTARFVSKEGDKIIFVKDDKIALYKNENYNISEVFKDTVSYPNIVNIVLFDDVVIIFTKESPYITFLITTSSGYETYSLTSTDEFDFSVLYNMFYADATQAKNGIFIVGVIDNETHYGHAFYFERNDDEKTFNMVKYYLSEYYFSYVLAMYKNDFSDAQLMFLKEGDTRADCKIVRFYDDQEMDNVYSILAYYYTYETKEVYAKNRAVVVEKTTRPYVWLYYYPQMYRYSLPLLEDQNELDNYISTNLLYLIQKLSNSNYKIYNLVGYNDPTEFEGGFPEYLNQETFLDFEFLDDILLIFTSDSNNPIIACTLFNNNTLIENVSSNEDSYLISYNKFESEIAENNYIKITLTVEVNIWHFQNQFLSFQAEKIFQFMKIVPLILTFSSLTIKFEDIA